MHWRATPRSRKKKQLLNFYLCLCYTCLWSNGRGVLLQETLLSVKSLLLAVIKTAGGQPTVWPYVPTSSSPLVICMTDRQTCVYYSSKLYSSILCIHCNCTVYLRVCIVLVVRHMQCACARTVLYINTIFSRKKPSTKWLLFFQGDFGQEENTRSEYKIRFFCILSVPCGNGRIGL
jgi:hypothetical protein